MSQHKLTIKYILLTCKLKKKTGHGTVHKFRALISMQGTRQYGSDVRMQNLTSKDA